MVSEARKAQARQIGEEEMRRFWGREAPEHLIEASYDAFAALLDGLQQQGYAYGPNGLERLEDGRSDALGVDWTDRNIYASYGLDAILMDLASRSITWKDIDQAADRAWAKGSEAAAVVTAEQQRAAEAGE